MRNFENDVQLIKYEVLKEVTKLTLKGTLNKEYKTIAAKIIPGPKPRTRCCIHKERAIIDERVKMAMGGNKDNKNIIEVLDIACDECPIHRFTITEACRGCLAHKCSENCPVGAIYMVNQRAYINTEKCIECGKCKSVCPYNAVSDVMRPCKRACTAKALSFDENKKAVVDDEKCIQCGACVYQCPFGAIVDKSFIVDVVGLLEKSKAAKTNVYAVIAPAISSQFANNKIGQVVTGIKKLGFHDVIEAALGADMVAMHECEELLENIEQGKPMTSSCCPAFVKYIKKNFPELEGNISTTVSPMIAISKLIKKTDINAKVVFIGPCTAKKAEISEEDLKGVTDYVLTFEELQAMLDAYEIDVDACEETPLNNASFYGRIFARSGGLTEAVKNAIESRNLENVELKPISCDGLQECEKALKLMKFNKLNANFVEGMACVGGCIGGAASLNHGPKDRSQVDKYGNLAFEKSIKDSLRVVDIVHTDGIDLSRQKHDK